MMGRRRRINGIPEDNARSSASVDRGARLCGHGGVVEYDFRSVGLSGDHACQSIVNLAEKQRQVTAPKSVLVGAETESCQKHWNSNSSNKKLQIRFNRGTFDSNENLPINFFRTSNSIRQKYIHKSYSESSLNYSPQSVAAQPEVTVCTTRSGTSAVTSNTLDCTKIQDSKSTTTSKLSTIRPSSDTDDMSPPAMVAPSMLPPLSPFTADVVSPDTSAFNGSSPYDFSSAGSTRSLGPRTNSGSIVANRNPTFDPKSTIERDVDVDQTQPTAEIHDAARVLASDRVIELCRSNPIDASYRGHDGWFALHQIIAIGKRQPPAVIAALVEAYPDAVFMQDKTKGMSPLHYACRFKASHEVIKLLLHGAAMTPCPPGCERNDDLTKERKMERACRMKDKAGRNPLYYAIRYEAPNGVMELLLKAHPLGAIEEDRKGDSPLKLIWDKYATTLAGKKSLSNFFQQVGISGGAGSCCVDYREASRRMHLLKKDAKLFGRFKSTDMLLRAAHFGLKDHFLSAEKMSSRPTGKSAVFQPEKSFSYLVHAIANLRRYVHNTLWDLARCLLADQINVRDEFGKLPLHYAVSCTACGGSSLMSLSSSCCLPTFAECRPTLPRRSTSLASVGSAARPTWVSSSSAANLSISRPSISRSVSGSSVGSPPVSSKNFTPPPSATSDDILAGLLDMYPNAASASDMHGRNPVSLALENRCHSFTWHTKTSSTRGTSVTEGEADIGAYPETEEEKIPPNHQDGFIRKLVISSPSVLYSSDPKTRLYPFMMAAVSGRKSALKVEGGTEKEKANEDTDDLTMVYEMLRMLPERMRDAI